MVMIVEFSSKVDSCTKLYDKAVQQVQHKPACDRKVDAQESTGVYMVAKWTDQNTQITNSGNKTEFFWFSFFNRQEGQFEWISRGFTRFSR